jgi:hypothetical protein
MRGWRRPGRAGLPRRPPNECHSRPSSLAGVGVDVTARGSDSTACLPSVLVADDFAPAQRPRDLLRGHRRGCGSRRRRRPGIAACGGEPVAVVRALIVMNSALATEPAEVYVRASHGFLRGRRVKLRCRILQRCAGISNPATWDVNHLGQCNVACAGGLAQIRTSPAVNFTGRSSPPLWTSSTNDRVSSMTRRRRPSSLKDDDCQSDFVRSGKSICRASWGPRSSDLAGSRGETHERSQDTGIVCSAHASLRRGCCKRRSILCVRLFPNSTPASV